MAKIQQIYFLVFLFNLLMISKCTENVFSSKIPKDDVYLAEESSHFGSNFGHLSHKHGTFWDGWMKGWYDGLKMCSEKHGFGGDHSSLGYTGPLKFGHADSTPVHHYIKHEHGAHKSHKSWHKGWH